jgi:hypothetical protein
MHRFAAAGPKHSDLLIHPLIKHSLLLIPPTYRSHGCYHTGQHDFVHSWHVPKVEQGFGDSKVDEVGRDHKDEVDEDVVGGVVEEIAQGSEGKRCHFMVVNASRCLSSCSREQCGCSLSGWW